MDTTQTELADAVAALQAASRERTGRAYRPDATLSQLLALLYDRDTEVAMLRAEIARLKEGSA